MTLLGSQRLLGRSLQVLWYETLTKDIVKIIIETPPQKPQIRGQMPYNSQVEQEIHRRFWNKAEVAI